MGIDETYIFYMQYVKKSLMLVSDDIIFEHDQSYCISLHKLRNQIIPIWVDDY